IHVVTFSTAAMIWVNSQLAVLARLHHLDGLRPLWQSAGPHSYELKLQTNGLTVSTTFESDLLAGAFDGEVGSCATLLRALRALVRSVAVSIAP
ncbi:MAG TPA: hypothetical protein VFL57_04620, partial [Bryobacteraceae bacterium]|nr:hypothetical protein [Bryobacteraceae bacterium]